MSKITEAQIWIGAVGGSGNKQWRVELDGRAGWRSQVVEPLVDHDLEKMEELIEEARSWHNLVALLSPNHLRWRISLPGLEKVGALIRRRLFGWDDASSWLARMAEMARADDHQLRFVITLDQNAAGLWDIPIELAFNGTKFLFKHPRQPAVRCDRILESAQIAPLAPKDRLLIATAHEDNLPPTRDDLRAHAEALCQVAERAGFHVTWMEDATPGALRAALNSDRHDDRIDALYIACHGREDADHGGSLALRGGRVRGDNLATWIADRTKPLKAALLCACSSATPGAFGGTTGMAQWLFRRGHVPVTMGYRSPVEVGWALGFTQHLFEHIGKGASIEEAFTAVRASQPNDEPQWPLPLLFARRADVAASSSRLVAATPVAEASAAPWLRLRLPPKPPRSYFTAREEERARLQAWLKTPGSAVITAVAGEGGVGKTELAAWVAHDCDKRGLTVLWLDCRDRDLRAITIALFEALGQGFNQKDSDDNLARRACELLRPHGGLLVLDDIANGLDVDALNPGGGWNVLVTTRVARLLSDAVEVALRPLDPPDAIRLLSRVAWRADAPPEPEAAGAAGLVERLGGLPFAIEMAGGKLRGEALPAAAYLEDLERRLGPATAVLKRIEELSERSLKTLGDDARRVLQALAVLPAPGARLEMVAKAVGEPEPRVARWLDRVVRYHLASFAPETGRYWLHPLMREVRRAEAAREPEAWDRLHRGTAEAMRGLADWIGEAMNDSGERALERWRAVRDLFDALDTTEWEQGEHGGEALAAAIAAVDWLQGFVWTPAARGEALDAAERLSRAGAADVRGRVLQARGNLRCFQDDLSGAAQDYDQALKLFETTESRQGQANVLKARGVLRRFQADLSGAAQDYDQALKLYQTTQDRQGQANVLQVRGDLRLRQADLSGAAQDYDQALKLYQTTEDRLGQANVLQARGDLAQKQGDLAAALRVYQEAMPLYETLKNALGLSNVLAEIAQVLALSGQPEQARAAAERAAILAEKAHNAYARNLAAAVLTSLDG